MFLLLLTNANGLNVNVHVNNAQSGGLCVCTCQSVEYFSFLRQVGHLLSLACTVAIQFLWYLWPHLVISISSVSISSRHTGHSIFFFSSLIIPINSVLTCAGISQVSLVRLSSFLWYFVASSFAVRSCSKYFAQAYDFPLFAQVSFRLSVAISCWGEGICCLDVGEYKIMMMSGLPTTTTNIIY